MQNLKYLFICFLFVGSLKAQHNIDFEYGDFTYWWGAYNNDTCGSSTPNPLNKTGIDSFGTNPQQTIVSIGNDPLVDLFPLSVNSPFGGNYSVRLGDTLDGCGASELTYTFIISPLGVYANNLHTYKINISYATVFNDSGNIPFSDAPKFIYGLTVCGGGIILAGDTITYSSTDTSFLSASSTISSLHYSNWRNVCLDLTPYIGICTAVVLNVISSDGNTGLNRGYAYLDVGTCGSTMSINSNKNSVNNISLFPNPATNSVEVAYKGNNTIQEIILYNTLGNEVLSTTRAKIDIGDLANGVYFINLKTKEGTLIKKLIVQH